MTTKEQKAPADFAAGLGARALHCRELGHNWRPLTATWDPKARVFDRSLRCPSCQTIRRQVLSQRGEVLGNRYEYPPGYLAQQLTEHPGIANMRALFRLEAVTRFLDKPSHLQNAGAA
jgi:hypothetical protein